MLEQITCPADLRRLSHEELDELAAEIRALIVESVTRSGGHLGSNLGIVEVTIALHRVFDSPRDIMLWDTGHQAYVHKMLTGRAPGFTHLRDADGLSGYPSRAESEHDWIEKAMPRRSSAMPTAWPRRKHRTEARAGAWSPSSATVHSRAGWPSRGSTTWATPTAT